MKALHADREGTGNIIFSSFVPASDRDPLNPVVGAEKPLPHPLYSRVSLSHPPPCGLQRAWPRARPPRREGGGS